MKKLINFKCIFILCFCAVFASANELANADEQDFSGFEQSYEKPATNDPFYRYNHAMHSFNTAIFNMTLRPAAASYKALTFPAVRRGVGNFFSNLSAPARALTLLLSGRGKDAASTFGGFLINSTAGLGGLLELAPHGPRSDFGLAAARWGAGAGAHLELPFFGPSNLRDAAFLPLDWLAGPLSYLKPAGLGLGLRALELTDEAAAKQKMINAGLKSINSYSISRDFYEKSRKDAE